MSSLSAHHKPEHWSDIPSCGRNFLQKAHLLTLLPSRTSDLAALRSRVSRLRGVCRGQYSGVQVLSADSDGFLHKSSIFFCFFFAIFKLEIKWRLIDLPSVYLFIDWPVRIMLLIPTLSFSPGSGLVYILLDLFPSILLARLYFIQEFFKKENWCSPQKKGTIFLNTKLIVKISFVALKEFRFKTHTHVHPYNTL